MRTEPWDAERLAQFRRESDAEFDAQIASIKRRARIEGTIAALLFAVAFAACGFVAAILMGMA